MEIKLKNLALEAAGSASCITVLNSPNFTLETTLAELALAYFKKTDSKMSSKAKIELNSIRFSTKHGERLNDFSASLSTLFSD